ncbi:MAG: DUF421 domain-containing protein [Acidobacteriia bacterium]|nr:DUF421 domain-containing protein [Terriglobia bacterium]
MMHWWLPEIPVGEKILRSLIVYSFLLIMFRLLGKREVAQMTVFDLVVLLILSNVLQNAMIGPDNSVTGGLIGAATILAINWAVGRAAFSSRWFEKAVEGVPTLLVHSGEMVLPNLRRTNISREELLSNLRSQGIFDLEEVRAAVLEPSGKLSVLKKEASRPTETSH